MNCSSRIGTVLLTVIAWLPLACGQNKTGASTLPDGGGGGAAGATAAGGAAGTDAAAGGAAGTTAGAGGTAGTAGAGGTAGATLQTCSTRPSTARQPGEPVPIWPSSATSDFVSGTAVFSLDGKTDGGWLVSVVSGTLPPPAVLTDGGQLSGLAVGDMIQVTAQKNCQPYSGCKSSVVVRDAKDNRLVTANLYQSPESLAAFAQMIGVGLTLEPQCQSESADICYQDQIDILNGLLVEADDVTHVGLESPATVIIAGRPYTVWLDFALTSGGSQVLTPPCVDQGEYFMTGTVILQITP
jgi:hypothetical protein